MNYKNISTFVLALLVVGSVFAGFVHAAPLPLTIDRFEVDDVRMEVGEVNRLGLERDETYEVEVRFTPLADIDNVEIEVFVSGYEYNDLERVSDSTAVFDADAGVTYRKNLEITFPHDVEEDDYRIRLLISDRNNDVIIQDYNVKVDVDRHELAVEDVYFSPAGSVEAGSAFLSTVRVENRGERDEDDVKVTVSLPTLGLKTHDYIEEVEASEEEETEEMFIRIPKCTEAGIYPVEVAIEYDEMNEKVTETRAIIVDGEGCAKENANADMQALLEQLKAEAAEAPVEEDVEPANGKLQSALWVTLLILLVLCVIAGLILAFNKASEEEF